MVSPFFLQNLPRECLEGLKHVCSCEETVHRQRGPLQQRKLFSQSKLDVSVERTSKQQISYFLYSDAATIRALSSSIVEHLLYGSTFHLGCTSQKFGLNQAFLTIFLLPSLSLPSLSLYLPPLKVLQLCLILIEIVLRSLNGNFQNSFF